MKLSSLYKLFYLLCCFSENIRILVRSTVLPEHYSDRGRANDVLVVITVGLLEMMSEFLISLEYSEIFSHLSWYKSYCGTYTVLSFVVSCMQNLIFKKNSKQVIRCSQMLNNEAKTGFIIYFKLNLSQSFWSRRY